MKFDFLKNRKKFYLISAAIILVTVIISLFGVKMDIQFTGGSIIKYSYEGTIDQASVEAKFKEITGKNPTIQVQNEIGTGKNNIVISLPAKSELTTDQTDKVTKALEKDFSANKVTFLESSNVDPSVGKNFFAKSIVAVLVASLFIVIYVAIRFRKIGGWSAGVTGVIALVHDVIVVYATFVIFGIPLNGNFVAVVLTILGYSINDTIVIYDRIRENKTLFGKKMEDDECVNLSINQCLRRTIITSVATVAAVVVVAIIGFIYNLESIVTFALPLAVGVVSGAYSSLFLCSPLWISWKNFKKKHNIGVKNYATKKKA